MCHRGRLFGLINERTAGGAHSGGNTPAHTGHPSEYNNCRLNETNEAPQLLRRETMPAEGEGVSKSDLDQLMMK